MKKILTAALLLTSLGISAQETYQNAELATKDLNGDARYVGMGGAMEALGANMSAATENPAALGLFRRGAASLTMGVSSHKPIGNLSADGKTVVNLDQVGFVIATKTGYDSYMNFGINYHKSTDFNQILSVASRGLEYGKFTDTDEDGNVVKEFAATGSQHGITFEKGSEAGPHGTHSTYSQVDEIYQGMFGYPGLNYLDIVMSSGDNYLDRERRGYIGNFDFTLSGNHQNRIYWGAAATISTVHYKNNTFYSEKLIYDGTPCNGITIDDFHEIKGTGFNLKGGVIFRPVEASPFRIGLSVETPTWYDLSSYSSTYGESKVYVKDLIGPSKSNTMCDYDFEISTPWKFGLSAGTTIGKNIAIGATYNYSDYSSIKSKIKDGGSYDWWTDTYYTSSHKDEQMNQHTSTTLKGVSTFKIGAECRVIPEVAVRLGYNYVSPMYKKEGARNMFLDSPGTETSSTTDFTNWESTNRFTCGIGFNIDNFSVDLAYQYNTTKGTYLPYQNCYDSELACYVTPSQAVSMTSDRHQVLCSLTYKF